MKNLIYLVIVIALGIKFGILSNPLGKNVESVGGYEGEVVLFATSWCGYCEKARQLLRQNDIEFTEYDIEKSPKGQEEYKKLNGSGIPLLVINGNLIRGYNKAEILRLAKDM